MPTSRAALTQSWATCSSIWLPCVIQLPKDRAETIMPEPPRCRYSIHRSVSGCPYARWMAAPDVLHVRRGLDIPLSEISWRATTSGGPGGQHANRTMSRVEVQFDVVASAALGPRQRARLLNRLGSVVRASAADSR